MNQRVWSLEIVTSTRSLNVRGSALHASCSSSLELSRQLFLDATVPMSLRKATIARFGHHGSKLDLDALADPVEENGRENLFLVE